jgi:uncharacterized protein YaeQ
LATGATVYVFEIQLANADRSVYEALSLRVAQHPSETNDIGAPEASRLHKASKAARRVAVYAHKQRRLLLEKLKGERIHRVDELAIYALESDLLTALAARLERRMRFDLSVSDAHLYITIAADTLSGAIEMHSARSESGSGQTACHRGAYSLCPRIRSLGFVTFQGDTPMVG